MSTKVYNAYRYRGTAEELLQQLFLVRHWHEEWCKRQLVKYFHDMRPPFLDADFVEIRNIINHPHLLPVPTPELKASAVVYLHTGKVYCKFFCLDRSLLDNLPSQFEDYSYWNNTDKPDEVGRRAWDNRKKTWDAIVAHGSTFRECGLVFDFLRPNAEYDLADHVRSVRKKDGVKCRK